MIQISSNVLQREDIAERLSFKEKRIAAYESSREYKKCNEMKEEMTTLKQHCQLEAEANHLKNHLI